MHNITYASPVGTLYLQADNTQLLHLSTNPLPTPPSAPGSNPILDEAVRQLDAYFSVTSTAFTVPHVQPDADTFRGQAQRYLQTVPYGQTRTYAEIATSLANPGAVRAVGSACATNPLLIIVPCHRVTRTDGTPGSYAGGASMKQYLLELEQANA